MHLLLNLCKWMNFVRHPSELIEKNGAKLSPYHLATGFNFPWICFREMVIKISIK